MRLSSYYRMTNFLTVRHGSSLIITLRMPLTSVPDVFHLYSLTTFPVPVQTATGYTKIESLPKILGIGHEYYFMMDQKPSIHDHILNVHDSQISLRPLSSDSCTLALF